MTRVFTEEGESIPVTVVEVSPIALPRLRTSKRDGYRASRLRSVRAAPAGSTSRQAGHFARPVLKLAEACGNSAWPKAKVKNWPSVRSLKWTCLKPVRKLM